MEIKNYGFIIVSRHNFNSLLTLFHIDYETFACKIVSQQETNFLVTSMVFEDNNFVIFAYPEIGKLNISLSHFLMFRPWSRKFVSLFWSFARESFYFS